MGPQPSRKVYRRASGATRPGLDGSTQPPRSDTGTGLRGPAPAHVHARASVGLTRIKVCADPGGRRARVHLGSSGPDGRGHLAARILALGQGSARVALVAEGALLLTGDLIEV